MKVTVKPPEPKVTVRAADQRGRHHRDGEGEGTGEGEDVGGDLSGAARRAHAEPAGGRAYGGPREDAGGAAGR